MFIYISSNSLVQLTVITAITCTCPHDILLMFNIVPQ